MLCHATVILLNTVTYSYTVVYSQHTPATNTVVATVLIAYYTTAYTPILLYSYHIHIDTIVLLSYTYRYYCTPIMYTLT